MVVRQNLLQQLLEKRVIFCDQYSHAAIPASSLQTSLANTSPMGRRWRNFSPLRPMEPNPTLKSTATITRCVISNIAQVNGICVCTNPAIDRERNLHLARVARRAKWYPLHCLVRELTGVSDSRPVAGPGWCPVRGL